MKEKQNKLRKIQEDTNYTLRQNLYEEKQRYTQRTCQTDPRQQKTKQIVIQTGKRAAMVVENNKLRDAEEEEVFQHNLQERREAEIAEYDGLKLKYEKSQERTRQKLEQER